MALTTGTSPWNIAVALGQPAPPAGGLVEELWQQWIDDCLMFIQDRADNAGVAEADIDQAKIDFVVREVVVDQVKRRDTDSDAEFQDNYRFRTVADWWPLLGLTGGTGAFSIDLLGPSYTIPWQSTGSEFA